MNAQSERLAVSCSPELKALMEAQADQERCSTAHLARKAFWAYLDERASKRTIVVEACSTEATLSLGSIEEDLEDEAYVAACIDDDI